MAMVPSTPGIRSTMGERSPISTTQWSRSSSMSTSYPAIALISRSFWTHVRAESRGRPLSIVRPATDDPPRDGEQHRREDRLEGVTEQERHEPGLDRRLPAHAGDVLEPRQRDRVQHDAADQHRAQRADELAVPAELGQATDDGAHRDEPDQVAAARAPDHRDPALAFGEERQADDAEQDIQRDRGEPSTEPEPTADQQHAEGLARDRDGIARDVDHDQRGQVDEQRAGRHEDDVPDPAVEPLTDPDGDEEVGDRE